jgi:hypothetical protein
MSKLSNRDVVTGTARLSYANLTTARAGLQGGEAKFSTTILIPKSDIATKQRIDAAIQAATNAGVSDKWNGVRPPILSTPVHDGDGVRVSDGMPFGEECKGHWVFTASSKNKPEVVDANLNPIINPSEIYSGMYARVSVNFFPYAQAGKKGIGCGLGPIQKIADGEPLGGRVSATEAFGGPADLPQAPQQFAQAYQQPAPQYQAQQAYPQPQYQVPAQQAYAPTPVHQYQPAVDPITGRPLTGPVMGI